MTDTTPAPPTDTAALNRQIAALLGWTCQNVETRYPVPLREQKSPMDRLTPPIKHERWFPRGEHYDLPLPDYCRDPAASLSLLEHILSIDGVFKVELPAEMKGCARRYCRIHVGCDILVGSGDTLPLAIALACRDALTILQETGR